MAWSWIQSASTAATATAGTSVLATYGTVLSSGTVMIAAVATENVTGSSTTVSGVTDSASHSFTLIGRRSQPTSGTILTDVSLWALATPGSLAGVNKPGVTATLGSGTARMSILVQEVSGILPAADSTAGVTGGSATGSTGSPSYTSAASGEYLVSVYGDDGGPLTWTKPAALTADPASLNLQSHADIALAYGNSTHGAEAGSWSLSGTAADWGTVLVAFKLAVVTPAKGLLSAVLFP